MKKKCKVVMLSTNEKSNTQLRDNKLWLSERLFVKNNPEIGFINPNKNQHLYFLSNEEIKEGNWCINANNRVVQYEQIFRDKELLKKIITTTDKSLGLPQPSQSFIEVFIREYNKGNVIEDVMVEYECPQCKDWGYTNDCRNGCNQMFIQLKIDKNNYISITKMKDSWSREEVIVLCKSAYNKGLSFGLDDHIGINDWIKENL